MSLVDFLPTILIALSLSADCFAVALGGSISMRSLRFSQIFRTALTFGFAQTLMAIAGWAIGKTVVGFISSFDHWLAFALLAFVGGRMIWEALHEEEEDEPDADISRGWSLLTLAIATSIDSLAVGLSFAFTDTRIVFAGVTIGAVAFLITLLGFYVGRRAGKLLGERAELAGGIILVAIGVKIVVTHYLAG